MKHVLEIEDMLGKVVPVTALTEISRMSTYFDVPKLSIMVKHADAVICNGLISKEIREMKETENKTHLKLSYDMNVFRSKGIRKATCSHFLYIQKKDNSYIKITLRLELELSVKTNRLDQMMFSACYLYAKNLFETLNLDEYTDAKLEFPENFASINEDSKEFYDGYIEYRNCNLLRLDVNREEGNGV